MGAVTYPDAAVEAVLVENFVGLKINVAERHPDFKEAAGGAMVPWAPLFRTTDAKGREVRRTVGWLAPGDFVCDLRIAMGLGQISRARFDLALRDFEWVAGARSPLAAEAGYYAGVAAFLGGKRDMELLRDHWNRLRRTHPTSAWAKKAAVIDDHPVGGAHA